MVAFTKGSRTQTMDHSVRNLVVAILSWIAEGGRQNLSERTKAEVARARQCLSTSEDLFGRSTGTAWDEYLSREIVVAGNLTSYRRSVHAAQSEARFDADRSINWMARFGSRCSRRTVPLPSPYKWGPRRTHCYLIISNSSISNFFCT